MLGSLKVALGYLLLSTAIVPIEYILDGTRETLITLGIVVLETNLELNSLGEVSLLFLGTGLNSLDNFSDGRRADLAI